MLDAAHCCEMGPIRYTHSTVGFSRVFMPFLLMNVLVHLSCRDNSSSATAEQVLLTGNLSVCNVYYGLDAYGYCIYNKSQNLKSLVDLERICSLTGEWESECRFNWLYGKIQENIRAQRGGSDTYKNEDSKLSFEELLKGCGSHEECYFSLIDNFPSKDISTQLDRCKTYAQSKYKICSSYALQRWSNSQPTEQEAVTIFEQISELHPCAYQYISKVALCNSYTYCQGNSKEQKKCQSIQNNLKNKPLACNEWTGCTCTEQGEVICATQNRNDNNSEHPHTPHGRHPQRPHR